MSLMQRMCAPLCQQLAKLSIGFSLSRIGVQNRAIQHVTFFKAYTNTRLLSQCASQPVSYSTTSQSLFSRCMTTLACMHRSGPRWRKKKIRAPVLGGCPQKRGVVLKVMIKKPKKPNSANRKCVRVRLTNGKEATAYVPGEGHNLQEHSIVLVRGGRLQDVPGVKLKCIRGKYDLAHVKKKTL